VRRFAPVPSPGPRVVGSRLEHREAGLWAVVVAIIVSCVACAGTEPHADPAERPSTLGEGATIPVRVDERVPVPKPPSDLRFLEWVASSCHVDELAPSPYVAAWKNYRAERSSFDAEAVFPSEGLSVLPKPHSAAAAKRAAELRRAWQAEPKSHVLDCRFSIPVRECRHCRGPKLVFASYVIYLPAAIVTDPDRIGAMLMLVPGGNGGRSRPFLSPIPGKTVFHRGSGGLETRQIVDRYLADHPEATPPIVVALDTAGAEYNNGSIEHLTHDLPAHIAKTYLAREASTLALGVEGISSGAQSILDALYAKPDAFATVGLSCLACGRIASKEGLGSPPALVRRAPRVAIPEEKVVAWAEDLAKRSAHKELFVRFSIGDRDGQLPCTRALHGLFAEVGVVERSEERVVRCHGKDGAPPCDREGSGLALYENEMHHYGILEKSFGAQLRWHLESLSRVAAR
jgi:hypothetical protein